MFFVSFVFFVVNKRPGNVNWHADERSTPRR